jgi:hypothetical protein
LQKLNDFVCIFKVKGGLDKSESGKHSSLLLKILNYANIKE